MPWEKNFDVAQARERAKALFWSKGYEATSMDDLLRTMDIGRSSFYDTFGGKRELYVEVLRGHGGRHLCGSLTHLSEEFPPREAILALFDGVQREASGSKGTKGCFLANAAMEFAATDRAVSRIVRGAFTDMESFFRSSIESGRASGSIRPGPEPLDLARTLLGLLLGIRVLARAGSRQEVLGSVVRQVEDLL